MMVGGVAQQLKLIPLSNGLLENKYMIVLSNLRSKYLQRLANPLPRFTQYFADNLLMDS